MTPAQRTALLSLFRHFFTPPTARVSEWLEENIVFAEPGCSGRFSFVGREYLREIVDCWGDDSVKDCALVLGTRMGKTRVLYGGLAYIIEHVASRVLYVKPTTKGTAGAEGDARTRFIPMLRASPCLARHIPSGSKRHSFKTPQQMIHGSIVDWTGSNSVANLASNPARVVIQDEVDKFGTTRKRDSDGNTMEADASSLADERCKEFPNPKRFKASTPTLYGGTIWVELMKSDIRRYFMPCPHCQKAVVFAWSDDYSVLPRTECEAYVRWDKGARLQDATWDYKRVKDSAHAECPHCHGKILDEHKAEMVRRGEWRPTKQNGDPGYRGYHASSIYSQHVETTFGNLAAKFLKALASTQGRQGFVNSDLAEPFVAKDTRTMRLKTIEKLPQVTPDNEWVRVMAVDYQEKQPKFWFTVDFFGVNKRITADAGHLDTWAEVEQKAAQWKVKPECVAVDSGYADRKDYPEVYRECALRVSGPLIDNPQGGLPYLFCWMPTKGVGGDKRWKDDGKNEDRVTVITRDPYAGTGDQGQVCMWVLLFASDYFMDVMWAQRQGENGYSWTVLKSADTADYRKHTSAEYKEQVLDRRTGKTYETWKCKSHWPNHLNDCEKQATAMAHFAGLLKLEEPKQQEPEKKEVNV